MPCYLFTYHAFGTWMPDRKQGYVQRSRGILAPDQAKASKYRILMKQAEVNFGSKTQRAILDCLLDSQIKQEFELYFAATDTTHVHILVSWRDDRRWLRMRSTIKGSMSRHLNRMLSRQEWFVEGGSRKRVKDRDHFKYLMTRYLPKHDGWKWSAERGKHR